MRKREKRERKKYDRGIVDFMMVSNHFLVRLENGFWKWKILEIRVIPHTYRRT